MWSRRAVFLVSLVVLGACAGGSGARSDAQSTSPQRALDAARARTAAAESGAFTMTVAAPGLERISKGAFSSARRSYRYQPDPATLTYPLALIPNGTRRWAFM